MALHTTRTCGLEDQEGPLHTSDLDESSRLSSVLPERSPPETISSMLQRHRDQHDTTWIKSKADVDTWYTKNIDDWRDLVTPSPWGDLDKSQLCSRCEALDLDTFFNQDGSNLEVSSDMSRMDVDCTFCSFLMAFSGCSWDFYAADTSQRSFRTVVLDRHSCSESYRTLRTVGYAPCTFGESRWPMTPHAIDFQVFKEYLSCCTSEHGDLCGVRKMTPVDKLRVFNCTTRQVERAYPGVKYVALSYLWGGVTCNKQRLPKTIEDAAAVTIKLGYNYLWVDQLCIDQNDPNRGIYIQQMDRIYHNAEVTIIAAAGDNADYGIPGVGSTSRRGQRCFKVGRHLLFEPQTPASRKLRESTWNTRGWTFQEGLLSSRRLVFTDREAWFACAFVPDGYGSEGKPPQIHHLQQRHVTARNGVRRFPFPFGGGAGLSQLKSLICRYSSRNLTVPSDVLDAFRAIFQVFERADHPIYHIWGVPLLSSLGEISCRDTIIHGLSWERSTTFLRSFQRRLGFPSWSWTGWIGEVTYPSSNSATGIPVSLERSGTVLSLDEFERQPNLREQPDRVSQFIYLDAWTFDVELLSFNEPDPEIRAQVELKDGTRVYCDTDLFVVARRGADHKSLEQFQGKSCTGVLLCLPEQYDCPSAWLVEDKGTWAERIGSISLGVPRNLNGTVALDGGPEGFVPRHQRLRMTRRKIRLR